MPRYESDLSYAKNRRDQLDITFGDRLRELRKGRGWSMDEVSEKLSITKSSISGYEQNDRLPPPEKIVAFAKLFNVSADYLLGQTDDPTPPSKLSDAKTYLNGIRTISWDGIPLTQSDLQLAKDFFDMLARKNSAR